MIYRLLSVAVFAAIYLPASAQYWQQHADYDIDVQLDVETHSFTGTQTVRYVNNSPDTLHRFFFHLFFNAFQPGSMMDVRSRTIADADPRVGSRIAALSPEEEGHLHLSNMRFGGQSAEVQEEGTIAVIDLPRPILPGATIDIAFDFEGQVPLQIRRSGRDNSEGVAYSMSQWYPRVVEYDYMGWHANPYVGREFHGVWGNFDVTVLLDPTYVFAGTGYEAEPDLSAFDKKTRKEVQKGKLAAHRRTAPNVHDFTWAADPDYVIETLERADGTLLEFVYQPGESTTENWKLLPPIMDRAFDFINRTYGQYPYEKYAILQGGDGGMEYAMCTLITGERSLTSLVGVSVHELMHSWYQFVLASNESLYPWMDEGFTSYASAEVMNFLRAEGLLPGQEPVANPHANSVMGYSRFANTGRAEPLSTHADHFTTNAAYGVGSYTKGSLFLYHLRSIIGEEAFNRGMLRYYDTWKFRHPTPNDFLRIMEKESGQELDWFGQYMVNTTHQVDYAADTVLAKAGGGSEVVLRRVGTMPAPVDVTVELADGSTQRYLIPLRIQRGHAPLEGRELLEDWPWTNPTYVFGLRQNPSDVVAVTVNDGLPFSEADFENNRFPRPVMMEDDAGE